MSTKTPVLTKKQQKSSLSAKKTKTKETLRNVLASPYAKYWPLISNGHSQTLKNTLNQYLPKLLPKKLKIPWSEIKKVPKSERKKFREQYIAEHLALQTNGKNIEQRDGLILGINDVTKALENQEAKSVLITEDILPRLMVEHTIDQAVLLGTPVLVVPELRNILKEKSGISSSVVAFTDCPRYRLVQDSIQDISKKYPVPENHINFNRAPKLTDSIIIIEDNVLEDNLRMDIANTLNKNSNEGAVENVHLFRETNNKRVFVPKKSSGESNRHRIEVDSTDFLAFSADTPSEGKIEKKYVSLKVLRIKGDGNRTKRKIEAMKERKTKQRSNKKIKKDVTTK